MAEAIPIVDREQWLALRRDAVTASVAAALFGCHPFVTELRLYAQMRGVEFPELPDNKTLRRGRWLEPAVARAVEELRPAWKLEQPGVFLLDRDLKLGGTPDYYIKEAERRGVLQIKTVAPQVYKRDWDEGRDLPLWVTLQCATETMLADADFGAVAVLLVDAHNMDVSILDVPRNPAAEKKIVERVKHFWECVRTGREPQPDYARDRSTIMALHPAEVAGTVVDLSEHNQLPEMLERRALLCQRMKLDEQNIEEIENEIRALMGDAERGNGLKGWRITYKTIDRAGYTVQPKRMRVLRIFDKREEQQQ